MDHMSQAVLASTASAGELPLPPVLSNVEILMAVFSLPWAAPSPSAGSRTGSEG